MVTVGSFIGGVLAVVFYKFEKAGFFLMGAAGGFFLCAICYNSFLAELFKE